MQTPAPNGWVGGLIAAIGVFLPSYLLVFGALPFWFRLRSNPAARAALAGVNAAVVGREAQIEATVTDPDGHGDQVLIAWDVGYDRVYETGPGLSRIHGVTPTETGLLPVVARAVDPTGRTARCPAA